MRPSLRAENACPAPPWGVREVCADKNWDPGYCLGLRGNLFVSYVDLLVSAFISFFVISVYCLILFLRLIEDCPLAALREAAQTGATDTTNEHLQNIAVSVNKPLYMECKLGKEGREGRGRLFKSEGGVLSNRSKVLRYRYPMYIRAICTCALLCGHLTKSVRKRSHSEANSSKFCGRFESVT